MLNEIQPVILIVEDDIQIRNFIRFALENEKYKVLTSENAAQAMNEIVSEPMDLILLDLGLPDADGMEVIKKVREFSDIPIIVVSARDQDKEKVKALDYGADDYLVKPFFRDELLARVHSLLRRYLSLGSASDNSGNLLQYYELTLNTELKKLYVRGDEVRLTATEYKIMSLLLSRPGRIFPAEEIYERVWEQDSYSVENTVMIHINRLRKKIELNPKKPEYLKVVWGIGYKIEK